MPSDGIANGIPAKLAPYVARTRVNDVVKALVGRFCAIHNAFLLGAGAHLDARDLDARDLDAFIAYA